MSTFLRRTSVLLCLALAAAACADGARTITQPPPTQAAARPRLDAALNGQGYTNVVLNADFPDPGAVRAADGTYYAYATQTPGIRIQVSHSSDLVSWSSPGEALPNKPGWAQNSGNFWAPDVNLRENGVYVMYFSAQADTAAGGFCVGMATSTNPAGPFADVGHPVVCGRDGYNIDPQGFDDPQTGKRYLLWGSGASIQIRQLSGTDRSVFAAGSSSVTTAQRRAGQPYESVLVEGAWMTYHAPYYYLYYSAGNCCNQFGPVSYAVLVARASSPTGPFEFYRNSSGAAIPVVQAGDRFSGPGHNAVVSVNGFDYMVYHAVDNNNPYIAGTNASRRPLLVDKITYQSNGWPIVGAAGVPTSTPQVKPGITSVTPVSGVVPDGWYRITPKVNTALAVDVPNCNAANGTALQTYDWLNNDCQKFYFQNTGSGLYRLFPRARGANTAQNTGAVDVASCAAPNPAYVKVQLYDWLNNGCQQWTVNDAGSGFVRLTPQFNANTALDVAGCSTAHGAQVGLWTQSNNDCQAFRLEPAQ